jgi:CRISPR-associated Csx14 family protein
MGYPQVMFCRMSPLNELQSILIATLGSEPQVVTAVLDLLLAGGADIQQVHVLHTTPGGGRLNEAIDVLRADARSHVYPAPAAFLFHPLIVDKRRIRDIETPEATLAAFQLMYDLIRKAKLSGRQVHLSIAGGRKNAAIYGMVAAQLLFDEADRLWHLYSGGEFLASKRLHPQPGDDVHLLSIPVLLRSYISPALTVLRGVESAADALEHFQRLDLEEKLEQIRSYLFGSLTPAEARVVELLAREGWNDRELAQRLCISARTVEQHLRSAYAKAADHWQVPQVNRAILIRLVSLYTNFTLEKNTGKPA